MPLKINGATSGSVTLAAPDTGSDVSHTLPTTALATEAYVDSEINSLALGKVRQVAYSQPGGVVSTSSGSAVSLNFSRNFTISANSRIMVVATVMAYGNGSGTWGGSSRTYLYVNGSEVMRNDHVGTISAEAQVWNVPITYVSSPLSAGTYSVALYGSTVISGTIEFNRDGNGSMILLEIGA